MSVDDLAQKFGGLNTETISYLKSAKRGEASLEGLSASMTSASISTKLLSVALNALSGLAISLIIKGFTWALDELIVTLDEQKQKLDEAVTAYEESKSELKQINDELKTTGERIDELNSKENLTFTEQDELEKLIKTNDELERKIYLLEQANKEAEKEIATEAQNTYDKYTNDRTIGAVEQIDFYADSSLLEGVSWDNFKGDLSWLVAQYKNQQEILTNAQANGWTQIEEQTKSNLELLEGYMSDVSLDYQDLYDKISGISDYAMTDELKVAKQDLDDILDIVAEILGYSGQRSETSFDDIWNSEDFSQYKTELETLAKEGKLDASVLESNENYKKLLEDTGTTAEDTAQHINALVDEMKKTGQEANKIDVSLDSYKKASEGISSLATAFKELTDDEYISLETISKIKEAVGDSIQNWDIYEQKLLSVKKGTEEYNQLMGELTYATLEKQLGGVNALAQADEKYVTQLLKENGVLNANEVAHSAIAQAVAKSSINLNDETDVIYDNVDALVKSGEAAGVTCTALFNLIAQEKIFNNTGLSVSQKVTELEKLAKSFGITIASAKAAKEAIANVNTTRENVLYGKASVKDLVRSKKNEANVFEEMVNDMFNQINSKFGNIKNPKYSSGDTKNKTPETFDWIETKISRLQRTITNLGKTVSDTFKSWSTRNKSLTSEISTITSAINEQKKATKEYKKQADSVKLSSSYKKKVRNGAIDIDTIKDDKTKANIKLYQEYYNKYLESLDAENELQANLNQKYKERFDLVKKQYEDELSLVENDITDYANRIDLSEAQGKQIKSSHYTQMIELQNTAVSKLQAQYNALQKELNSGKIKKGTEEWYSLQNEIDQVKHSLDKAKISLEEYKQSQREVAWDIFDDKQQKKSNFTSDNDFLLGLLEDEDMYDDNGNITKYGKSSNALHAINLDTYIQQAKDYATAISDLDKQYANDKNNSFYLERRRDLVEAQQEAINNAKDEKQAMIDLAREGYDALLDSMQKIIDKRKKMLSEIKNARDYEKSIRQQTDEISVIQKQLISYQGDDSEEARAAIQRLQKSLKDAEENLEETQYDKFIQDQEQLYDDLMEDTQTWVNELFENESTLLERIAKTTAESGSLISETIKSLASNMGYNISGDLSNTLKDKGYAKGSKNIPYDQINWIHKNELLYRASDGGLLMPLGSGDKVFTKEMSDRLWDIAQIGFKPVLPSIPNITLNGAGNNNGNGDITFDIKMYGVNDPQEFAQQLKEVYDRDIGNVRKMINTDVHSKYGSMNYRRYL